MSADLSDDEVFFGPITERERLLRDQFFATQQSAPLIDWMIETREEMGEGAECSLASIEGTEIKEPQAPSPDSKEKKQRKAVAKKWADKIDASCLLGFKKDGTSNPRRKPMKKPAVPLDLTEVENILMPVKKIVKDSEKWNLLTKYHMAKNTEIRRDPNLPSPPYPTNPTVSSIRWSSVSVNGSPIPTIFSSPSRSQTINGEIRPQKSILKSICK